MRRALFPLLAAGLLACTRATLPPEPGPAEPVPPEPGPAEPARAVVAPSDEAPKAPMYRALAKLPPESIADNEYGKYLSAPEAPQIGDVIAPFSLPVASGGTWSMAAALPRDLVIVFYRGFW